MSSTGYTTGVGVGGGLIVGGRLGPRGAKRREVKTRGQDSGSGGAVEVGFDPIFGADVPAVIGKDQEGELGNPVPRVGDLKMKIGIAWDDTNIGTVSRVCKVSAISGHQGRCIALCSKLSPILPGLACFQ